MGRQAGIALAAVLTLAWAGVAVAQEPGETPDLDVDISIDVVTDFDHMGPGADVGGLDHEDDVNVVAPGDGDHHDRDEGAAGDDHEAEMEGHDTEVGGAAGGFDEGTDGMGDGHEGTEHD
jgi:hypothetical protein